MKVATFLKCLYQYFSVLDILCVDYNLLEEVKRVAESAQRVRTKLCGNAHFKLPCHLNSLRSAAASRRTKLLLLPNGMSKREKNQTRYNKRLRLEILEQLMVDLLDDQL